MKRSAKFILGILVALFVLWLVLPAYLRQALIHQQPGIYDYQIFNNRTVGTGLSQPWELSAAYNQMQPSPALRDSLLSMETTAFLVIQNDSILYEYYPEGLDPEAPGNSFSMAKSIVSLLIGCALADGNIESTQQGVEELLPDLPKLHGKGLRLDHLLTMSSGSSWDESYSSPFSITTEAYYGNDLQKLLQRLQIEEKPGNTFSYRSGDTQLLAQILLNATGRSLADYAAEKLWRPLGAEQAALWSLDQENGMEKAYCCFNSNARDFARLGQLLLNKGHWKGQQLLPEAYINAALSPATHLKDEDGDTVNYYGYQIWLLQQQGEIIPYLRGILGQYIFVLPETNAVVVRLGHRRSEIYCGAHTQDAYTWLNIARQVLKNQQ